MEPRGFDELHIGASPRLLRHLTDVTGDEAVAQAVLDEAFARAWALGPRLGRELPEEEWVRLTAEHLAARRRRRPGRQPLSSEEVRRRGDRLRTRRRRTATVLAAGVLVAGVAVGESTDWSLPDPGPDPDLILLEEPRDTIPGDFPLTAGLSTEGAELDGPRRDLDVLAGFVACAVGHELMGQLTDQLAVSVEGDGYRVGRQLVLAKELDLATDDLAAQGILERFIGTFDVCPSSSAGGTRTTIEPTHPDLGEDGWRIVRTTVDGPAAGQEVVYAVRVGRAVIVSRTSTVGTGTTVDADAVAEEVGAVVAEMCIWADRGCQDD